MELRFILLIILINIILFHHRPFSKAIKIIVQPFEANSDQFTASRKMTDAKKESQTYPCRCHCGEVTFTITLSPPLADYTVMQCNCSICTAHGYLLVYPNRSDVIFHGNSMDHVQKYQFHTKKKDHWFCSHCGTSLLIDFNGIYENFDVMAVNARTIENIDISALKLEYGNGKEL